MCVRCSVPTMPVRTICAAHRQKSFIATSAKNPTLAMMEGSRKNPTTTNLVSSIGYLLLGGNVPIKLDNKAIGAVGIRGAPGGNPDEQCAAAAIDKIKDQLK